MEEKHIQDLENLNQDIDTFMQTYWSNGTLQLPLIRQAIIGQWVSQTNEKNDSELQPEILTTIIRSLFWPQTLISESTDSDEICHPHRYAPYGSECLVLVSVFQGVWFILWLAFSFLPISQGFYLLLSVPWIITLIALPLIYRYDKKHREKHLTIRDRELGKKVHEVQSNYSSMIQSVKYYILETYTAYEERLAEIENEIRKRYLPRTRGNAMNEIKSIKGHLLSLQRSTTDQRIMETLQAQSSARITELQKIVDAIISEEQEIALIYREIQEKLNFLRACNKNLDNGKMQEYEATERFIEMVGDNGLNTTTRSLLEKYFQ